MCREMLKRMKGLVFLLVLISLLLGACRVEPTEAPTPSGTPEPTGERVATVTSEPGPTFTPLPTPAAIDLSALPLPSPCLVARSPATGEELDLDAPVELAFDQSMDRASVEDAFSITPKVAGRLSWLDDRTLAFAAYGGLERGAQYRVAVSDTARSLAGERLSEPVGFDFSTVGFLNVSEVQPVPGRKQVYPDTPVTLVFNRPVVELTAIELLDELPHPLSFTPPVTGTGEWLNTSIYIFRPAVGFLPATEYEARVPAGLSDTTGGVLPADYVWTFETVQPVVVQVWPSSGSSDVPPTNTVGIEFNQPMDHESVESLFSLKVGNAPVAGTFRWEGGESHVAPETMVFVPNAPMPRETRCVATLRAGALTRAGKVGFENSRTWQFNTVRVPRVITSSPRDGATGVDPYGRVEIEFAGPMRREGFVDHVSITPPVEDVYAYWSYDGTEARISFQREAATTYVVTLDADTPDEFGMKLGKPFRVSFTTGDFDPYAVLQTSESVGTFSAYTETVVYAGFCNVSRLELSLYRIGPAAFRSLVHSGYSSWQKYYKPGQGQQVRQWVRELDMPSNQHHLARFDLAEEDGSPLSPGIYFVELYAPEMAAADSDYRPAYYAFVRSRLNLTMKQSRSEVLIWATDLATGEPVPRVGLSLYGETHTEVATGVTDEDGLLLIDGLEIENLWDDFFAVAGVPGEDDFAIAFNGWDSGIRPWEFNVDSDYWGEEHQAYLYTDRPIYRPAQTVYFKGIVRFDDDANLSVPQDLITIGVRIEDPQGKKIYDESLFVSDMGTFHDELALDEEAPLGTYYIQIRDSDRGLYASASFRVAEYKKPEYQVSVTTEQTDYVAGDVITVTAEATYYFGGPVTDAEVHWSVLSGDFSFRYDCPQGCPWYRWADYEWGRYSWDEESYGQYGRLIAEGDAKTDESGQVTFRVPADITQENESRVFTIEVSVTDLNDQQVSNRTATVVHLADFYVGVAPRRYIGRVGEEKEIDLITVDRDGEAVADVELTVVFMEHRWYSVREREEDGGYYWTWVSEDIPVLTETVTTGDDGRAVASFAPQGSGTYRVRAIGRDAGGNEVRSCAYLWVWGGRHVNWRRESNNRIDLIADKQEYQVGDVAEILVPSPYSGTVQVLLTIERGHIMEAHVLELNSNSAVLRVPIKEAYVPNVFVSVVVVQGSEQAADGLSTFKMGLVNLPVSIEVKQLNITLTPDRAMEQGLHYGPRETATYDVLVTDDDGNPVQAEVSLRLADLAVLALADEQGPTILDRFWRTRGLGVKTSLPLVVALEKFNREIAPGSKGGGGGEADAGLIRTDFADTAFWAPAVRTDEDGRAQVTVELPDNLTTWRMQARGITAETQAGRAEVDVLSTLDLMVRPVLPRFFVVGDHAEIATIVHNNTPEALPVTVDLNAEGLTVDGPESQTVDVPSGGKVKVIWPVTAIPGSEVTVRTTAAAADLFDGWEATLPVHRYTAAEVVATSGRLSEAGVRLEIVQLPPNLDPTQGELRLQVDGSLTAATQEALDYLKHYPYECVEQTVSRFLPNVVTYQALKEMGFAQPQLQRELSTQVSVGLQRLYAQQHYDGGWGWWALDKSNIYITAYVLQALMEAHRAGFAVDQRVMREGADFLRKHRVYVSGEMNRWEANRQAYVLYVLAEYGVAFEGDADSAELSLAIRLYEVRHRLDRYGQAMLAVALSLLEPEEPARVQVLLGDLIGDAVVSATGTYWEEAEPDYWNMNTNVRTAAMVVWALSRLEPESELLPNAVRWLMSIRQQGYWDTTQSTVWSLLALVEYMRASGEMEGDFNYTVYLNQGILGRGVVNRENIAESRRLQIEISEMLLEEGNRLVIQRHAPSEGQTGGGQLYYSAYLRYFLPADQIEALNRGIIVARQFSLVDDPEVPIEKAEVGDLIRVRLTLIAPSSLHYVVVESPLPAGCEGVDLSLKTTSVVGERPKLRNVTAEEESRWYRRYGWGWWWFSHTEMRDEKVALFATYLSPGTYEYTYLMRATVAGEFKVLPAFAYEMYFPEVFGRSDGGTFTITAGDR